MKIITNKNVEIIMHFGEMQIYVDDKLIDEMKVPNNAACALYIIVRALEREGVIID